jgi:hypothetical protein
MTTSVGAQLDRSAYFESRTKLCKLLLETDRQKGLECVDELKREAEAELRRLDVAIARQRIAHAYLARFGIAEPDLEAKYEVAKRRRLLFAVILDDCWRTATSSVDAFTKCLDQREKTEVWLGNKLNASAPPSQ